MKSKSGWYYSTEGAEFGNLRYVTHEEIENDQKNYWNQGPFNTFSQAKADALDYFRTDVITAHNAIREIKNILKRKLQ